MRLAAKTAVKAIAVILENICGKRERKTKEEKKCLLEIRKAANRKKKMEGNSAVE